MTLMQRLSGISEQHWNLRNLQTPWHFWQVLLLSSPSSSLLLLLAAAAAVVVLVAVVEILTYQANKQKDVITPNCH